jgi:hypothetical protein
MEARGDPLLICQDLVLAHCELAARDGAAILTELFKESRDEEADAHSLWWYRQEQAAVLGQVLVERFAAGVESVFIGQVSDWDGLPTDETAEDLQKNVFVGLLDSDGAPQPAFYAYLLAAQRTSGFDHVETIHSNLGPESGMPTDDQTELHRFVFADGRPDVLVAWLAEEVEHGREPAARGAGDDIPTELLPIHERYELSPGRYCEYRTPAEAVPSVAIPHDVGDDGRLTLDSTPAPFWLTAANEDGSCP